MSTVLHLRRVLSEPPRIQQIDGVSIRTYGGEKDIERWLEVRRRAFARERLGVRQWDRADFLAEFLDKPWWQADHLWFAEQDQETIGVIAMAMRGADSAAVPAIHWLAVAPPWRRRKVGALLVSVLESAAWNESYREVHLETHSAWTAARNFYEALGYSSISD